LTSVEQRRVAPSSVEYRQARQNVKMSKCQNGKMAKWQNGKMAKCQNGQIIMIEGVKV
jgi:hypothetical protein